MNIFIIYILGINIITFLVYGIDKYKARKGLWRIPEKILLGLAIVGGSVGALLGMKFFHHKTQKFKFKIGVPFILFVQITVLVYLICLR